MSPCRSASNQEPKAPLAEPDSESPASELPPSEIAAGDEEVVNEGDEAKKPKAEGEEDEARNTDVCPWEDE